MIVDSPGHCCFMPRPVEIPKAELELVTCEDFGLSAQALREISVNVATKAALRPAGGHLAASS